jgi:hypothetical protein
MPRPLQSFDVFDTLLARRCGDPQHLLHLLETRAGLPGLAAARSAADQHLGKHGPPYTLIDIWHTVRHTLHLDEATTARLLALEIHLEQEQAIPIVDNLALVHHGDLLVSDTYLPADVVLSLLRQVGLTKTVTLVTTNDGKFRGWLWPQLLAQIPLRQHMGDNPHSDGHTPTAAGIKAVIYTGAKRTPVEEFLTSQGWTPLANLLREVRLANPFPTSQPAERHLWLLSCQLNFPLLFLASLEVETLAHERHIPELLFVSRDCLLWHHLYQHLFPQRRSLYLFTSRHCLLKPSDNYLHYFRAAWHPDSLIIDLFSTGSSWAALFARLHARARCFFIGHVDNYAYLPEAPNPNTWLDLTNVFCNSALDFPVNKNVEMLNYAPYPSVEDVRLLPGNVPCPVLADTLEYDHHFPEAAHRAFRYAVQQMGHYPDLPRSRPGPLTDLIKLFVKLICADPHLSSCYPHHHAADAAYLQRLLS